MRTIDSQTRRASAWDLVKAQWRVLVALMLRDIKTRWGSSLGFLMTIAWPLSHILIVVILNVGAGRTAPYGDSAILWFSISMIPFMVFSYVSRFVLLGILQNKPLLTFPAIKTTDILFSKMLIEIVNMTLLIAVLLIILWALDVDFVPFDMANAAYALGASVMLGMGLGIINSLIGAIYPMWITVYFLSIIFLWITSGVLFIPNSLPESLRYWLYFQPCVHLVEWMREAYYPSYSSLILDKVSILIFSGVAIFIGLLIERVARGRIVLT